MFKYLLGIILVQIATVVLVLLAPPDLEGIGLLRLIIPIAFIGFVAAFWFSSLAHHLRKDHLNQASAKFAKEREHIRVNAERAKARVMKDAQKEVAKEARVTHAKANFKVGATFAGAIGLGALLLLTQFLTIGIVLLTTSGGALAGYVLRGRKENKVALEADNASAKLIEVNPIKKILPKLKTK
ncbi:MAG: hypothetical protein V3U78_01650 [Thiotrichaceae bacterium]